jgi:hypothetical protein
MGELSHSDAGGASRTANSDEAFRIAESLSPAERLGLIARLWATLPQEIWPKSTDNELAEADRLLAQKGIARGESVAWPVVEQMLADCVRSSRPKVYSAPRRFDLATIFVVMSAYAVLFAVMAALKLPPAVSMMTAGFIAVVGVGQALLFRGLKPRTASLLVGAAIYCIATLGYYVFYPRMYPASALILMLVYGLFSGGVIGYVAGTLVGGVFLVADFVRRRFSRAQPTADSTVQAEESPFSGG